MSPLDQANTAALATTKMHGVLPAGGSRALLGSAGHLFGCHFAGISEWETIGGISGGSIPALALAIGMHPAELMHMIVDVDFSSLVPRHATPLHTVLAFMLRARFEYTRPRKGVLTSEPLGVFIRQLLTERNAYGWPKNYWTSAVCGRTQLIFTANGVYQYLSDGTSHQLTTEPAPIEIAIRATCAIPGIIDAVDWDGRALYDGILSWDGQCPVGIPLKHFKAQPDKIIACDVGEGQHLFTPIANWFWSLVCGGHCVEHKGIATPIPQSVLMMRPNIWSVRSLQFSLDDEQKWQAVLSGFQEAIIQLSQAGLLTGDRQQEAFAICMDVAKLKALAKKPS